MYNVKQSQSEINELKEKLSIQQQKNQLNELSNEREGELRSEENQFVFIYYNKFTCESSISIRIEKVTLVKWLFPFHTISSASFNKEN